jgi:hypothetical protein
MYHLSLANLHYFRQREDCLARGHQSLDQLLLAALHLQAALLAFLLQVTISNEMLIKSRQEGDYENTYGFGAQ